MTTQVILDETVTMQPFADWSWSALDSSTQLGRPNQQDPPRICRMAPWVKFAKQE